MRPSARLLVPILLALLILLFAGRAAAALYTEILWYNSIGYSATFWTRVVTELSVRTVAAVIGGLLVFLQLWLVARRLGPVHVRRRYGNLEIAEQIPRRHVLAGISLAAVLTGLWLSDVKFGDGQALNLLTFSKRASWGVADPLFGRDLSFYVFTLPVFMQVVDFLLLVTAWSLFLCVLGYALIGTVRWQANRLELDDRPRLHLAILVAAMVALLGVRYWLSRYGVLYNGTGFGSGVGYTDIHARLPGQRILAILSILTAGTVVFSALRRTWVPAAASAVVLALAAVILGALYPSAIQKFRVEPDELLREQPYIAWNIEYTRRAYGLHDVERRPFRYKRGVPASAAAISEVPVWDPDPLLTVFNEVQTAFSYYHFTDIDFDRYATTAGTRQVAVGVREFFAQGLQDRARTWQTLHLNPQYLRGLGAVMSTTADKEEGRPVYWLNKLPVEVTPTAPPQVQLRDPSIYFGETMEEYAILNTVLDTTVARELRPVGISMGSFARVLAFASRFSEKNLLFSGQLTDSSTILFRRRLDDRLRAIAPFILWDRDAQPVISNGHVVWLLDGYTASTHFPIARPLRVEGAGDLRYLSNSVKATVDAVTGQTVIYALHDEDPLLKTYRAAFPGVLRPLAEMPAELQAHLRYPAFYLRAQADILEEYHLNRPEAFYAGQDVWQVPRRGGNEASAAPFQPLYTMLSLDAGVPPEFLISAPFIAQRRRNLTAMLFVRNDPPNYGKMVLLEIPRDLQVPGPAQVDALVEQDPLISPQLSLWRQAGSDVTKGEVRIVPVDSTFVYLMPLFLAAQGRPIPELQRVVASDGDRVYMASTAVEALAQLRGSAEPSAPPATGGRALPVPSTVTGGADFARRALELMQQADAALRAGDWAAYGARQRQLRDMLEQAARGRQN